MTVGHAANALFVGVGIALIVIGTVQIARTLQLGMAVNNANSVVTRCAILIGVGVGLLYALLL